MGDSLSHLDDLLVTLQCDQADVGSSQKTFSRTSKRRR